MAIKGIRTVGGFLAFALGLAITVRSARADIHDFSYVGVTDPAVFGSGTFTTGKAYANGYLPITSIAGTTNEGAITGLEVSGGTERNPMVLIPVAAWGRVEIILTTTMRSYRPARIHSAAPGECFLMCRQESELPGIQPAQSISSAMVAVTPGNFPTARIPLPVQRRVTAAHR